MRRPLLFVVVVGILAFAVGLAYAMHRPLVPRAAPAASAASALLVTPAPAARLAPGETQPAGMRRRAQVAKRRKEEALAPRGGSSPVPAAIALHPAPHPIPVVRPPATPVMARAAIIIDDCGASLETIRPFLHASQPVTLSILPYLPFSREIAREAASARKGVMLHFPMQTVSGRDPGQGTLRVDMTDEQMQDVIRRDFAAVPFIEGVNNHEGSRATADPHAMQIFLKAVKDRGLFFIDSYTAPDSCAYALASRQTMACARRDVFLDNEENVDAVKEQIRLLLREAQKQGSAIGIGHARHAMATAFVEMIPAFEEAGVRLVTARELARSGHGLVPVVGPEREAHR